MTEPEHSPLPWRIGDDGETLKIRSARGNICHMMFTNLLRERLPAKANAELIIRAVNSHNELVEALIAAKQFIENGIELGYIAMPDIRTDNAHNALPTIRKALAKAKGETDGN